MAYSNRQTNVGDVERVASGIAGSTLVTWGLRRRSLGGLLVAAAGADLVYRGFTGHCNFYQWLGKTTTQLEPAEIKSAITIGKPADELYRLWRDPENLSRIMGDFAHVEKLNENRFRWSIDRLPGEPMQWDTETIEERSGEYLRWSSLPGASLPNDGEVRFRPAPQGRGTEVSLMLHFKPPGGVLGKAAIKALGPTPRLLASHVLRRFKSLAETGEIATIRHNPSARASRRAA